MTVKRKAISTKPLVKHSRIHKLIDVYLKERSLSKGGWAPVQEQELSDLDDIINLLINAKYGPDPDGDRPINYIIIDRTSCEPLHYQALPYSPRTQKDAETAQGIYTEVLRFEIAMMNLSIAAESLRVAAHPILKNNSELAREAIAMEAQEKENPPNPVDVLL